VPKDKRDHSLREKLAAESDGIFMWALVGLRRVMNNGYRFNETAATRAELEKYRTESSSSLSFADMYLTLDEEAISVRDEVYNTYKEFCNEAGFKSMSQTIFNRDIEAQYPTIQRSRDKVSKRRVWTGLRYIAEGRDTD